MEKNKDKKAKRTSDVFLETSPHISWVHESPLKLELSTDSDCSTLDRLTRLETWSSKKAKKKQNKRDLLIQECEKECAENCSPQTEAKFDFTDVVDGLTADTSPHEEPRRKKKKREELGHSEETMSESDALRKKEKKKKKRSIDEVEEINVSLVSDENDMMSDERTRDFGMKKNINKDKEKKHYNQILDLSTLSSQENRSSDLREMVVDIGGCSASTELEENEAENKKVKKKKNKSHKEKKNPIGILESEESVNENVSTDTRVIGGVNISAKDVQTKKKKEKKKDEEKQNQVELLGSLVEGLQSEESVKKNGSTDSAERDSVLVLTDLDEYQTQNILVEKKKKKKKDKEKHNQNETLQLDESVKENGSTDPHKMDGVGVIPEPVENQTKNILIKEKKRKQKKKQLQTQVFESATTSGAQSQNESTDLPETENVNVSTGPEKSLTKKRRKENSGTRKKSSSETRATQTIQKRIEPKQEADRVQIGTGFRRNKNAPVEITHQLLEELRQFIPNVDSRDPLHIQKIIRYDLPRYREFKKKGIPLSHGRFSVKENEMLRKNVEDFMALTGIDSGTKLFFTHRFEDKQTIRTLKKNHRFFEAIAEGIPRSCHHVYSRGRNIFDSNTCKGVFSKREIHQLHKLHTIHGNNWKKISELTGRSAISLEKRYSQITPRTGMWSEREVQRLLRAVQDYIVSTVQPRATNIGSIQVSRETLYKGLPWQTISKKVKTRSWVKCREKWLSVLSVRMSSGAVQTVNAKKAKIKLIKMLYELQVEDVADVDWEELSTLFGNVPPAYVQKKWNKLKVCHVPNHQSKCFGDIVDFLYENVLPGFEKDVTYTNDEDISQIRQSQAQSFFLSDIFEDINDQDLDEEVQDEEESYSD